MKTLVFMNRLKSGKWEDYKKFSATNTGAKKVEYADLLKRYGLLNVKVYHPRQGDQEYAIVIHDAQEDALEKLSKWSQSTHPYDRWFNE